MPCVVSLCDSYLTSMIGFTYLEMLSLTFRKTIGCYRFEWFLYMRVADDSVESTGVFIGNKKTATEVAVFIYLEITLLAEYPQRASLG